MLRVQIESFRYPDADAPALRDVRLNLVPGEIAGLVGANGSGKTTLCLVAAGLAPRWTGGEFAGSVTCDEVGQDAVGLLTGGAAAQLSGQAETVYDEVAFGPMNRGLAPNEVRSRTSAALDLLHLPALAERDPRKLSGGQQQLVVLAAVLAMRPRYLVADEPVSELDPAARALVADALARLAAQGVGILLAEHDTALLQRICQRFVVLQAGQVVCDAPKADVLARPELEAWGVAPPALARLRRLIGL